MALTRRPDSSKVDAFISGAPDARPAAAPVTAAVAPAPAPVAAKPARVAPASSRKQPISLTIDAAILAKVDERAAQLGLSRAAAMALACSRWVESEGKGA